MAQKKAKAWGSTPPSKGSDEWYTPPDLIEDVGPFDCDPCAVPKALRQFHTAAVEYDKEDDGFQQGWQGAVWLNPPFSKPGPWVERMAGHGHGIALVGAFTETGWFRRWVFGKASGLLFLAGRPSFRAGPGAQDEGDAGGSGKFSPVLVAYGKDMAARLGGGPPERRTGRGGDYLFYHGLPRAGTYVPTDGIRQSTKGRIVY